MMKTRHVSILLSAAVALFLASGASAATLNHVFSLYEDAKGTPLLEPRGLDCDGESRLIVADTGNHRLVRYTLDGSDIRGGEEIKVGQMWSPVRVKLDSKGGIFVLDGRSRRILRLSERGKFKGYVTPTGLPAPDEFAPLSFEIGPKDALYVLDVTQHRVVILDTSGKTLRTIPLPEGETVFTDLTVDPSGTVYLLDTLNARVHTAGKGASSFVPLTEPLKELMTFPTTISTDGRGLLYVVDQNGGSVVLLSQQDGSFQGRGLGYGWNEGRLRYPGDFCSNGRGQAFIADRANSRVQIVTVVR